MDRETETVCVSLALIELLLNLVRISINCSEKLVLTKPFGAIYMFVKGQKKLHLNRRQRVDWKGSDQAPFTFQVRPSPEVLLGHVAVTFPSHAEKPEAVIHQYHMTERC